MTKIYPSVGCSWSLAYAQASLSPIKTSRKLPKTHEECAKTKSHKKNRVI